MDVTVRRLADNEHAWLVETLQQGWGSTIVARLGEAVDAAGLPGIVAYTATERVGLLTYQVRPDGVEVVTIQALYERQGIGRALLDEITVQARAMGASCLWLVTTNDNIRALDVYQRHGLVITRLVIDGVQLSRAIKPSIPHRGANGIAMRHEVVLQLALGQRRGGQAMSV